MLAENKRHRCEDRKFTKDVNGASFVNYIFTRLVAKEKVFNRVDFRYCIFDSCYLRDCNFIRCDFTGCRFQSTSFHGSKFSGCTFPYATFKKTIISDEILVSQAPDYENQKAKFARTLRMNYQQLGEAESVNKAIRIELEATRTHLFEAWYSKKSYYRKKYRGSKRVGSFFKWAWFDCLHFLWGNGESVGRLTVSLIFLFCMMAVYHAFQVGNPQEIRSYWDGIRVAPEVFLGAKSFPQYSNWYLSLAAFLRLTLVAALISILIKRFSRR
ncbi:MAG TPA: pentapeptide repeat-containing protein [Acidobacteriaceae bacterium]|nr:pentapeptide repeat-containing protein [Acidobacteriaceae bacterium]